MTDQHDENGADEGELPDRGWPDALEKAVADPFVYEMGLRSGMVIRFESAVGDESGLWVHLTQPEIWDPIGNEPLRRVFERGMDVRASDIMWVVDAPDGS